MRGKFLFITGGLLGYVLGARAGRKRYEQIASTANSVWNAKPVQRRVTEVRDFALDLVGDVPSVLLDAGKKVVKTAQTKTTTGKADAPAPADTKPAAKGRRGTPETFPSENLAPDGDDASNTN
ncbi:MAG: hypothetical protein R6W83_03945 [Cryobacterium sp.]